MLREHMAGTSSPDMVGRLAGCDGECLLETIWREWQPWIKPLGFPFKKEFPVQLLGVQLCDSIQLLVLSGLALAFKLRPCSSRQGEQHCTCTQSEVSSSRKRRRKR